METKGQQRGREERGAEASLPSSSSSSSSRVSDQLAAAPRLRRNSAYDVRPRSSAHVARALARSRALDGGFSSAASCYGGDEGDDADGCRCRGGARPISVHMQRVRPGQWVLGEHIGSGSFGRVFKAMNRRTGEEFAVKEVRLDASMNELDVECLAREIEVMRRLCHENIVRYLGYEVRHRDGQLFIFQEWVPGNSLSNRLQTYGRFSDSMTRRYTRQVLKGLAYLHGHGVVHMDIKCENLLLDKGGVVKLGDFGTAEWIGSGARSESGGTGSASSGTRWGTPLYMAPEVLTRQHYSPKADVWAVGGAILQMVTLSPPWAGMNFKTPVQLARHMSTTKAGPDVPGTVSASLRALLARCFAWEVADRPTAQQLLADENLQEDDSDSDEAFWKAADAAPGFAVQDDIKRTMYSESFAVAAAAGVSHPPPQHHRSGAAGSGAAAAAASHAHSGASHGHGHHRAGGGGGGHGGYCSSGVPASGAAAAAAAASNAYGGGSGASVHKPRTRRCKSRSMDFGMTAAQAAAEAAAAAVRDGRSASCASPPPPMLHLHWPGGGGADSQVPMPSAENPFSRPRRPRLSRLLLPTSPTSSGPATRSPDAICESIVAQAPTPLNAALGAGQAAVGAAAAPLAHGGGDVLRSGFGSAARRGSDALRDSECDGVDGDGEGDECGSANGGGANTAAAAAAAAARKAAVRTLRDGAGGSAWPHRVRRYTLPVRCSAFSENTEGAGGAAGAPFGGGGVTNADGHRGVAASRLAATAVPRGRSTLATVWTAETDCKAGGQGASRPPSGGSRRRQHGSASTSSGTTTTEGRSDSGVSASAAVVPSLLRQEVAVSSACCDSPWRGRGDAKESRAAFAAGESDAAAGDADCDGPAGGSSSGTTAAGECCGGSGDSGSSSGLLRVEALFAGDERRDGVDSRSSTADCQRFGGNGNGYHRERPRRVSRDKHSSHHGARASNAGSNGCRAPCWRSPSPLPEHHHAAAQLRAAEPLLPPPPPTTAGGAAAGSDEVAKPQLALRNIIARSRRGSFAGDISPPESDHALQFDCGLRSAPTTRC